MRDGVVRRGVRPTVRLLPPRGTKERAGDLTGERRRAGRAAGDGAQPIRVRHSATWHVPARRHVQMLRRPGWFVVDGQR